jgi:hypothetical protein
VSVTDALGDWQDGALLVVGSVAVGYAAAVGLLTLVPPSPVLGVTGFAAGALVAFLALSYLCYGR